MKLIVFGATGMVGKQLVQQALFKGHHVKAFGRNVFTTDFLETDNLELVQGALFDEKEVYRALQDCDAVLSALGGNSDGTDKTRSLGMKIIAAQMEKAGVKRIVAVGGLGVLNGEDGKLLLEAEDYPQQYLAVGMEHRKAWEYLQASPLDWTFVCSPDIIDAGPTGHYITRAGYPPEPNQYRINAGDLALFMLNELEKNEYVKERVGISN
jgi:putative NADH-flavin reductase